MSARWPLVRVEDFAEKIAMGPFGSSIKVETFVDAGVPIISGQHLRGFRVTDEEHNFITPEHATKLANANVRRGDVIFTHAGTIGQAAFIPQTSKYDRYVISQRQFYLRCDVSKALPEFITYYFHSPDGRHKLLANTSSSGVPSIARPSSYLKTIEVPLPPLAEQRAIAEVLGALDDKIDLNERTNATLDQLARALFKSWFVDFDPVRTKAEGRQPSMMDAATAALFPDSFADSALGPIPAGWDASTVGDQFSVTMGQSPPGSTYNEAGDGLPFFQGRRDFGFRFPTSRVYCTDPRRVAAAGDTLVSVRAPVGDLNRASEVCCIGRGVAAARHRSGSPAFTFQALVAAREQLAAYEGTGTVFGSINRDQFGRLAFVAPLPPLVDAYSRVADPLEDLIEANWRESRTLAALRDTLLLAEQFDRAAVLRDAIDRQLGRLVVG